MTKYRILHIPSSAYLPVGIGYSSVVKNTPVIYYTYEEGGTLDTLELANLVLEEVFQVWARLTDLNIECECPNEDAGFMFSIGEPLIKYYGRLDIGLALGKNDFEIVEVT